jgi:hypothetical protein
VLLPAAGGNRPIPVIPFWRNVGETAASQVLHIEWKPDFLRRVKGKLRPYQRPRKEHIPGKDDAELATEIVVVHTTTGRNIGWRLDLVLASRAIADRVTSCVVQREFGSSDHGPVIAEFALG